jgi:hypothetical protein
MLHKTIVFNNNNNNIVIILKGLVVAKTLYLFIFLVQSDAILVAVAPTVVLVAEYNNPAVNDQIFIDAQTLLRYHIFPWFSETFQSCHSYYLSAFVISK